MQKEIVADGFKTDSQIRLDQELENVEKWSLWFTVVFLILSFYGILRPLQLIPLSSFIVRRTSPDLKARCEIPELENTNWSFDQKQKISYDSDSKRTCFYYDIDYESLSSLPYETALNISKQIKNKEKMKCKYYVLNTKEVRYTFEEEFNIFCNQSNPYQMFNVAQIGAVIVPLFSGVFGDIHGRRNIMITLTIIAAISSLSIVLFKCLWLIYISESLAFGTEVTLDLFSNILFLEVTNHDYRNIYHLLIRISHAIGLYIASSLCSKIRHWKYLAGSITAIYLVPLSLCWLLPESPRWLLCTKNWKLVFDQFEERNYPVTPVFKSLFATSETVYKHRFKDIMLTLKKPLFIKRLLVYSFFSGLNNLFYYVERTRIDEIVDPCNHYFNIIGHTYVVAIVIVTIMLFRILKKTILTGCLLFIGVVYLSTSLYERVEALLFSATVISFVLIQAVYHINVLSIIEQFPTPVRCTAMGICQSVAASYAFIHSAVFSCTDFTHHMGWYGWIAFAATTLIGAVLSVFLRNSFNSPLPDNPVEAEYRK